MVKKTFLEWSREGMKSEEKMAEEKVESTEVVPVIPPVEPEKEDKSVARVNPILTTMEGGEGYSPSWKSSEKAKQVDKKAATKNSLKGFQLIALILIFAISVGYGGYYLWEEVLSDQVLTSPGIEDQIEAIKKDAVDEAEAKVVNQEVTYYLVEIAAEGTRQIAATEFVTSCGDIIVPVTKEYSFEVLSGSANEVTALAKIKAGMELEFEAGHEPDLSLVNPLVDFDIKLTDVIIVGSSIIVDLEGSVSEDVADCQAERVDMVLNKTIASVLENKEIQFKLNGEREDYSKSFGGE